MTLKEITDLGKRYWVYDLFTSDGDTLCYDDSQFKSRRKATIAAIDAALDYIEKQKGENK